MKTPCHMIGLAKTGRAKPLKGPPKAFVNSARLVECLGGLLMPEAPITRRARERFPAGPEGDALFLEHLDALGERLRAAEPVAQREGREREGSRGIACYRRPRIERVAFRVGARTIKGADLRVVGCGRCGRTLLGPSDEPLRAAVHRMQRHLLPPPVAGHRGERPACANCL